MIKEVPITTKSTDWSDVDASADADTHIQYLDKVEGLQSIQQYKRKTSRMLDLRLVYKILDVGCGTGEDARRLAELVGDNGIL